MRITVAEDYCSWVFLYLRITVAEENELIDLQTQLSCREWRWFDWQQIITHIWKVLTTKRTFGFKSALHIKKSFFDAGCKPTSRVLLSSLSHTHYRRSGSFLLPFPRWLPALRSPVGFDPMCPNSKTVTWIGAVPWRLLSVLHCFIALRCWWSSETQNSYNGTLISTEITTKQSSNHVELCLFTNS